MLQRIKSSMDPKSIATHSGERCIFQFFYSLIFNPNQSKLIYTPFTWMGCNRFWIHTSFDSLDHFKMVCKGNFWYLYLKKSSDFFFTKSEISIKKLHEYLNNDMFKLWFHILTKWRSFLSVLCWFINIKGSIFWVFFVVGVLD